MRKLVDETIPNVELNKNQVKTINGCDCVPKDKVRPRVCRGRLPVVMFATNFIA